MNKSALKQLRAQLVKATCYASVDGIKLGPKVEELQKGPNK